MLIKSGSKYRWAGYNRQWLKNMVSLLHGIVVSNRAPRSSGPKYRVNPSGTGGWSRKMRRAGV